jgi:hypothetical protein
LVGPTVKHPIGKKDHARAGAEHRQTFPKGGGQRIEEA